MPRKQPLGKIKPKKSKPPAQDPIEELLSELVNLVVEEQESPQCSLSLPEPPSEPAPAPPAVSQVQTRAMGPLRSEKFYDIMTRELKTATTEKNLRLRKVKEKRLRLALAKERGGGMRRARPSLTMRH